MLRKTHPIATVLVALSLISTVGCGRSASPESVLQKFKSAIIAKDYKTAFSQMTSDNLNFMIGGYVIVVAKMEASDPQNAAEAQQILEKYGALRLDESAVTRDGQKPRMTPETLNEVAGPVKDKPGCLAELFDFLEKARPGKPNMSAIKAFAGADLTEVKIDGDSAVGKLSWKRDGQDYFDNIKFQKISGVWLISFSFF